MLLLASPMRCTLLLLTIVLGQPILLGSLLLHVSLLLSVHVLHQSRVLLLVM
jgi:hypothetical protein